ncbi:hypothetical protein BJX70DRAFT_277185 [Aspergillus crustosus]
MAPAPSPLSSTSSSTWASYSSPLLYPSSCSSAHSVPPLSTNLSPSSSSSFSYRPPSYARDQLDNLIARHGRPTRFSLSSLEELTATCSTYNPPSPLPRRRSPALDLSDTFEDLSIYRTRTKPIPIPRSLSNAHEEDIPVTPLTGRFERDYFPHRDITPERDRNRRTRTRSSRQTPRYTDYRSSRMRSDTSPFLSPVSGQTMSSSGRSGSPQPSRARVQNAAKSAPAFQLGDLPRFHPAVYQPPSNHQASSNQALSNQPSSPRQSRQHAYRPSASSRDPISQYRDFVGGVVLQKPLSRPISPSPSAPRLDPLLSPGPVTPLALEEAGGYLSAGTSNRSELSARVAQHAAPTPDLLDRPIARENERARQKARKAAKGW